MSCTSSKNDKDINFDIEISNGIKNANNISTESEKKLNFFEMNLKFKNKININYSDFDFQKGELSPKFLFRKRKLDNIDNLKPINNIKENEKTNANLIPNKNTNNNVEENSASKISSKIKAVFDNYLDFVHESYFTNDKDINSTENKPSNNNINLPEENNLELENKKTNTFKFSSLDLLMNPLRKKYVFELWNPYEIALFECCVCKFNKNFDLYPKIIRSKSKEDIINFYFYWKQSKFYKIWKNTKSRRMKVIK